jgi:hypothetical protein
MQRIESLLGPRTRFASVANLLIPQQIARKWLSYTTMTFQITLKLRQEFLGTISQLYLIYIFYKLNHLRIYHIAQNSKFYSQ